MHTCIHTYIHTYVHTYIHTHIHTYIHTYLCITLRYITLHTHIHTHMYIHTEKCVLEDLLSCDMEPPVITLSGGDHRQALQLANTARCLGGLRTTAVWNVEQDLSNKTEKKTVAIWGLNEIFYLVDLFWAKSFKMSTCQTFWPINPRARIHTYIQTDRRADRQTDRQAGRHACMHINIL